MSEGGADQTPDYRAHPKLRPGQDQMMEDSTAALERGGFHVAAAPTGIGKTAAALQAAIATAINGGQERKVMFLTGRKSQHRLAVETVRMVNGNLPAGIAHVKLVDIIGQQAMCVREYAGEHPTLFSKLCSDDRRKRRCRPFFEEAPSLEQRIKQEPLDVEQLVQLGRSHREGGIPAMVCPWGIARRVAGDVDVIVCDYNHIFLEGVRDTSLSSMKIELDDLILVVDEAHNLPDRIRRGLERRLTAEIIRDARIETQEHTESIEERLDRNHGGFSSNEAEASRQSHSKYKSLQEALVRLRRDFLKWRNAEIRQMGEKDVDEIMVDGDSFLNLVQTAIKETVDSEPLTLKEFSSLLLKVEVEVDPEIEDDEAETAATRLATVIDIIERFASDPALVLVLKKEGDRGVVTTHLLDPALVSAPIFAQTAGAILMSGTLNPPQMYADLLGLPKKRGVTLGEYPSPFLSNRRPVAVGMDVTTRFQDRGTANTKRIHNHIDAAIKSSFGHVAVFAPSYAQLREYVGDVGWGGINLLMEESSWSKKKADGILGELERARAVGQRVLLAGVFGGRLGEGVDYHDNLLDVIIAIGIPNAPPSVRNDALKEYVGHRFGKDSAWRYAVIQPSVNAVLQAMGRAIRNEKDRAFVLLLDKRHVTRQYLSCHPNGNSYLRSSDSVSSGDLIRRFFGKMD